MGLFDLLFGVSPLLRAIESGDQDRAKELIQQGSYINQKARVTGATPLFAACIRNYRDIAEMLLSKGADVNSKLSTGKTILHFMAEYKNKDSIDTVAFLLSKGAKIEIEDANGNAFHAACQNKDPAIAELLVQNGADIHKRNRKGLSPLHLCVFGRHAGLVGLLLDKGADVNDADNDAGASPLHIAAANGDAEITNLLLARQANPSIEEKNGRIPLEIAQAILPSEHVVVKILRQREEVEK